MTTGQECKRERHGSSKTDGEHHTSPQRKSKDDVMPKNSPWHPALDSNNILNTFKLVGVGLIFTQHWSILVY